ncbi:MAG: aldo/keto reductase [Alphaproteobacteria bacterium]|nr:aldo/keto reductase [Alphaproteobacteria bacterium]
MRYRHLGRSGLRVSQVCLGTMSFGDRWGFGADAATSREVFERYAQAGGNFLDTANKYHEGHTEEIVADLIAADRDRFVVATKYTLATRADDPNACGNGRKNMIQAVEKSLKRLRTDRIDLYWVHAWDFCTPVDEVMRGLDDLVRSGKVLYVGISDAPAWVVSHANTLADLRGWSRFVGLQIPWSLIERTVERELVPMARAFDIGITAWAPLGAGLLTGKYTRGEGPGDSKRAASMGRRLTDRNLAIAKVVDTVADELGVTSTQVAVAWVASRGVDVVPIVGARKPEQIADVLGAVDVTLPEDALARLEAASAFERGFPHDFLGNPDINGIIYGSRHADLDRPPPRG